MQEPELKIHAVDLEMIMREQEAIVVTAISLIPPHAGIPILCVCRRADYQSAIDVIKGMGRAQRKHALKSIVESVKKGLSSPLPPPENKDLMSDLVCLFAFKIITRSDEPLKDSGLMELYLMINPDTSLPWQKRGMLDPKETDAAGLDVRPRILG